MGCMGRVLTEEGVRNLKEITLKTPVKSLCYSNGVVWVGGVGQIGCFYPRKKDNMLNVFDVHGGRGVRVIAGVESVKEIWTGGEDSVLNVWSASGGTTGRLITTLTLHNNAITAISEGVMSGTAVVASASSDLSIYVWNAVSRAPLQQFRNAHHAPIVALRVLPTKDQDDNGSLLSCGEDGSIHMWR